ncbi:MAG TPA: hypothetical protein VN540_04760 [Clostridia bacterium]|nr:hypothetical protein [Clostridia bacterium]
MRAAIIKNKTVVSIIVAGESVFAELEGALGARLVSVDNADCGIGWTTEDDGRTFSPPVETEGYEAHGREVMK